LEETPSNDVYSNPRYYEIAFSWRDIQSEVDAFEECFRRYSKIPVRRVLELACGTSPHLEEWARRGYDYVGLDINRNMLSYAQSKAKTLGASATFLLADMRRFSLEAPVEFAYVMLGSLYVNTAADLVSHLESVARALKPGGLYFLDWCINFDWGQASHEWVSERGGVKVDFKFFADPIDRPNQIYKDRLVAYVDDHGKKLQFEKVDIVRVVFPQEFLLLVDKSGKFEFIGWWNNWHLHEPVETAKRIERPITIIRRS
jgi:SAM-dependent methyltransferase